MLRLLGFIIILSISLKVNAQNLQTKFEQSNGKETVTYQEGIAYWKKLSDKFSEIHMQKMGDTDSGEPLHLIIFSKDKVFDLSALAKSEKPTIFINNGIHAGETDGVDASMMLLRNFAQNSGIYSFLDSVNIALIPFYNIGGVLNRNSTTRVNQNGPKAYGFRGNARNFDLNRDFIKMDSKNAFSFVQIFKTLDPEVFVDTHVTNGTDHQHVLTLISTQWNKLDGELGNYLENNFENALFERLRQKDREPIVYVNVHGDTPNNGWTQFWDAARYSSGYTSLYQTLGFISESHMWKPYQQRVENTYDFLEAMVALTAKEGETIKAKREADRQALLNADSLTVQWKNDKESFRMITLKGYETSYPESELTGNPLLHYNRDKPIEKEVPFYNSYTSTKKVAVPDYYIIPQAWQGLIDRLRANDVKMNKLKKDTVFNVEAYHISDYKTAGMAYEGHYLHYNTSVSADMKNLSFRKGDYLVPTNQLAKKYIVEVLEPEAQDSFFNWNFFDTILQQKEGFSDYVFEPKAKEILANMPEAEQAEFSKLQKTDTAFANSNYAQLDWIYKRSEHYEKAHLQYPIYRLMAP
ncbi:M14 family metallopeptidase [Marivirga atlantica]|uniref:Peptidase M14 domain-containing protein n=1 Tax=Marivirga atlantica TaxID=1548457 RepID=A0A937AJW9_9BACT|nr:M14 family zinc carboxypeptidase [Marivirga atlantica]MBL0764067.1 hypothetical protein [Marivirga atlantica]